MGTSIPASLSSMASERVATANLSAPFSRKTLAASTEPCP